MGMMIHRRKMAQAAKKAALLSNEVKETVIEEKIVEEVKEEVKVEEPIPVKPSTHYTKTDINRMSTAELKTFARKEGIKKYNDLNGGELKKVLIEHFGL